MEVTCLWHVPIACASTFLEAAMKSGELGLLMAWARVVLLFLRVSSYSQIKFQTAVTDSLSFDWDCCSWEEIAPDLMQNCWQWKEI